MAEPSQQQDGSPAPTPFVEEGRREISKAVFVYSNYTGDAGPPPPAPPPPPPPALGEEAREGGNAGSSALSSVFVMANCTVGAGVLSLPYAFQKTGLIGGLLLCLAVGITEALTLYVLSKFAERYQSVTYVQLVRRALGRKLAALLSAVLMVSMFGACIAYLIILGDTLSSLAADAQLPAWATDRHHVILLLATAVMLPLCLPRQIAALATLNQVAILGFLAGAAIVAYRGGQTALSRPHLMEGVKLFVFDSGTLYAIPIVVFGFNCHSMVVSIFAELEGEPVILLPWLPRDPSTFRNMGRYAPRPGSTKLIGMMAVIMTSTLLVFAAYALVGISGYMAFPGHVDSNILVSFPQGDTLMLFARASISLIVLGSYPLTHHPARAGFEHLVEHWAPLGSRLGSVLSLVFTLAFVFGGAGVALVVTDLGVVLHLLGGLCITFMIFFLPGLLLINAAVIKHTRGVLDELEAGAAEEDHDQLHAHVRAPSLSGAPLTEPLLRKLTTAADKGIKKGLMFAPRLSWALGSALIALSVAVAAIALVTSTMSS